MVVLRHGIGERGAAGRGSEGEPVRTGTLELESARVEQERAFSDSPAVVATRGEHVYLLDVVLSDITHPGLRRRPGVGGGEVTGVEGEPERVPQAHREQLGDLTGGPDRG